MAFQLVIYRSGDRLPDLPGSNTFHSTELFRIYEATHGYRPILVVVYEGERPVAKLLGVVRKSVRLFPPALIRRCEVYGSGEYFCPKAEHELVFATMLECLTREALRQSFLIEFRNLNNALFGYKAFCENRYFPVNWLRVRNSLHSSRHVEERFSTSRLRQVRKGLKNGAEVREAQSIAEIQQFAQMLHHVYSSKIRRHFPSIEFFQQLEAQMVVGKRSKIFIVLYKHKIIGGSACIYSGDTAYLWFSGGMRKLYAFQYPGILAVWKAFDDAKRNGYRHLEFMDVGLPFQRHGYREFVLRFGGKQISTRRWFRFRWKWLNEVLIRLFR